MLSGCYKYIIFFVKLQYTITENCLELMRQEKSFASSIYTGSAIL